MKYHGDDITVGFTASLSTDFKSKVSTEFPQELTTEKTHNKVRNPLSPENWNDSIDTSEINNLQIEDTDTGFNHTATIPSLP